MLSAFAVCTTILAGFLLILLAKKTGNNGRSPPGPRGVPILGNLLQMGTRPHLKFSEWAHKYGKLFTVHLAGMPTLVVNDANLMRELFGTMASTGRMKTELMLMLPEGSFGLGNAEGLVWLEQKQFFLKALKIFGFGRGSSMEPRIVSEADELIDWIEKELQKNGSKMSVNQMISDSVTNVLWSMITGERIVAQESKIVRLLDDWLKSLNVAVCSGLIFFSWIKYFAPVKSGYVQFKNNCKKLREFVEVKFEEHKMTRISDEPPRDMIDAYIDKVESCTDAESSFNGTDGWKHSFGSIVTLMLAGGESTGTMINWFLYYLSVFPEVQEKLQEEIDTVIGQNSAALLINKAKMPYMEAVILEVLRMSTLSPFGVMQELLEGVNFHGYHLCKGTLLITNLYHVHYDQTIWGDPNTFRPERFLDKVSGEALKDFVVAFQPGKRTCPGARLAKDIMFIFATKILQNFTFSVDPSVKNVRDYLEPIEGFGLLPRKFSLMVESRM